MVFPNPTTQRTGLSLRANVNIDFLPFTFTSAEHFAEFCFFFCFFLKAVSLPSPDAQVPAAGLCVRYKRLQRILSAAAMVSRAQAPDK